MRSGWTKEGNTFVLQHNDSLAVVMDAKDGTYLWKLILTIGGKKEVIRFPNMERAMMYAEDKMQYASFRSGISLWALRFLFLFMVIMLALYIFARI